MLSERTLLRSVTVGYDPQFVSIKESNQILKDGDVLTEKPHITTYGLTDYERFFRERPVLANLYAGILEWTPAKATLAKEARAEEVAKMTGKSLA